MAAAARAFLGDRHSEGDGTKAAAGANARAAHTCAKGAPCKIRFGPDVCRTDRGLLQKDQACQGVIPRAFAFCYTTLCISPPSSHHKYDGDAHGEGAFK